MYSRVNIILHLKDAYIIETAFLDVTVMISLKKMIIISGCAVKYGTIVPEPIMAMFYVLQGAVRQS